VNGQPESESEKPKERYGASYLAMQSAQQAPVAVRPIRRRSGSRLKVILLLLLIAGLAAYHQRARLVPWLEQNPRTAPLVLVIREKLGLEPEAKMRSLADVPDGAKPVGGETTFSSGQGYGTVTPDDGSDSFRVVVPEEAEKSR
jgi:hypothetical protein